MKVRDKAIELRDKFIPSTKVFYNNDWVIDHAESKKCALICVDEIIKSLYRLPSLSDVVDRRQSGGYWEEVKQEINKL